MDYTAHYNRLIERARGRVLVGYRERHHVLPKCMGGGNDPENIVELTGEEHYVAHQLLVKMYPEDGRLAHAAMWMARRCSNNKAYGWLRMRHAIEASQSLRGKKRPPEVAIKIAVANKLRAGPRGPLPASTREKMSAALRGRRQSPEHIARAAAAQRGKKKKPCPQEKRVMLAITMLGNKYGVGYRHTAEALKKISAASRAQKRLPMPQETRDKIAATLRARNAV